MIQTRRSIYSSLRKLIKEVIRHANYNPDGFKDVMYAVILNDMKEWAEYVPSNDSKKIQRILEDFILKHSSLQIERIMEDSDIYKNVNTPQDNTTWSRIYDNDQCRNDIIVVYVK